MSGVATRDGLTNVRTPRDGIGLAMRSGRDIRVKDIRGDRIGRMTGLNADREKPPKRPYWASLAVEWTTMDPVKTNDASKATPSHFKVRILMLLEIMRAGTACRRRLIFAAYVIGDILAQVHETSNQPIGAV